MLIDVRPVVTGVTCTRQDGRSVWSHISIQFLGESLLLASIGGLGGVILGAAVTAGYASLQGWSILIPAIAVVGGIVAALLIGAVAGLYPAMRAARVSPTEALRTL